MDCRATEQVATIGINIGKNSLHLIGLEGCFGSTADQQPVHPVSLLSGGEPKESVEKPT